MTKVVVLLMEKAFCLTVRSTLRAASTMFSGRFEPVKAKDGKPNFPVPTRLGAVSRPSSRLTSSAT